MPGKHTALQLPCARSKVSCCAALQGVVQLQGGAPWCLRNCMPAPAIAAVALTLVSVMAVNPC